jgi:hypothetical protein
MTRADLHRLVDDAKDPVLARFQAAPSAALRTLADASGDPVAWMLDHAPLDDEPETEKERRAVAETHADRERGIEPVPLESVLTEFDGDQ